MKLLRVKVIDASSCGNLLDDLNVRLRRRSSSLDEFDPLCLIGPNGAGKSQFMQVIAEIFQSLFCACVPEEERRDGNPDILFELEYLIKPSPKEAPVHVRVARMPPEKRAAPKLVIQRREGLEWVDCDPTAKKTKTLLPQIVVGYTSGDNETLSLPFLISREAYAEEVRTTALSKTDRDRNIPNTRLMLIDYGTHLEVLMANLLFGTEAEREALLGDANLRSLYSCRCVVQLAHLGKKAPRVVGKQPKRKGVQLTDELEEYLKRLQSCSTCHHYEPKTETYTLDFLVTDETKKAFAYFWKSALDLYTSLHKLSMLNDLAIPKKTRDRFRKDTKERHFASRLPEPQDEDKIFRFERVQFVAKANEAVVDYVALSDGEHQLAQLLGMLCMVSFPNAIFLLDEPESHFNPKWRAKCITRILEQPTRNGTRGGPNRGIVSEQECLLTTHSPFLPSDMRREKVFIFRKENGKVEADNPNAETFGASFDSIIEECFGIRPPISDVAKSEIDILKESDAATLRAALPTLGDSMEKVELAERLRQLTDKEDK